MLFESHNPFPSRLKIVSYPDLLTNMQRKDAVVRITYRHAIHFSDGRDQKCVDIFCVCIKFIRVNGLTLFKVLIIEEIFKLVLFGPESCGEGAWLVVRANNSGG